MKLKTKLVITLAAATTTIAIVHSKKLIEHRLLHQLKRRFSDQKIYGIWLRKLESNPITHRYVGGINIEHEQQLDQYRFTTDETGQLASLKIVNRRSLPEM